MGSILSAQGTWSHISLDAVALPNLGLDPGGCQLFIVSSSVPCRLYDRRLASCVYKSHNPSL